MSVQALSCAFAVRGLSPSEKLVLLALSNFANEKMQCWPSQERLAADTELSERTVWGALKALEAKGMVVRTPRKRADGTRSTDVFTLHFALVVRSEPVANPANSSRNPCEDQSQVLREPVAAVATLTTFEPSGNRQEEEPCAPIGATKRSVRKPETTIPAGFPDLVAIEVGRAVAEANKISLAVELQAQRFRAHAEQTDRRCRDWPAAWRNWLLKSVEDHRIKPPPKKRVGFV